MHAFAVTLNLREDEDYEEIDSKLRRFCASCEDALCVREMGTKYGWHWHLALRSRKTPTAFRRYFVKTFLLSSQDGIEKTYCIKKWDNGLEYLRYCAKGPTGAAIEKPIVVYNTGYDLEKLHTEYFEKRLEMIEKREKEKKARKTKPSLRDSFFEFAISRRPDSRSDIINILDDFLLLQVQAGVRLFTCPHKLAEACEAVYCAIHPMVGTNNLAGQTAGVWMRG